MYNPARFSMDGTTVKMENEAISGVFNYITMTASKFTFGFESGGTSFAFEYYSGNEHDPGGNDGDETTVAVPANLRAEDGILIWDPVAGATEYDVNINGDSFKTYNNTYSGLTQSANYAVKVRALSGNKYSNYTGTFSFVYVLAPGNLRFENGVVKWSESLVNYGYCVRINGALYETSSNSLNIRNIGSLVVGTLNIQVKTKGNDSTVIDSKYSGAISVEKISDAPVLTYNKNLHSIKETDTENAALFNATAVDCFGGNIPVAVTRLSGEKAGGSFVSYRLSATDIDNNTTYADIANVAVYGSPVISYTQIGALLATGTVSADTFNASARDSFGQILPLNIAVSSGSFSAGAMVGYRLSTVDSLGNTAQEYVHNIKVYGNPVISNSSKQAIKVSDTINSALFNATAADSFGQQLQMNFSVVSGTQTAAGIMSFRLSATDVMGQTVSKNIDGVKVYGNPVIHCGQPKTAIKTTDTVNAFLFSASAEDSFGAPLVLAVNYSGTKAGGTSIAVVMTATDAAGNVSEYRLSKVDVYATPVLNYTSLPGVKLTDDEYSAALYSATAKDSFDTALPINITVGGDKVAGGVINITLSVTDVSGNTASKNFNIMVYGIPTFQFDTEKAKNIRLIDSVNAELFGVKAKDSFGAGLYVTTNYSGTKEAGSKITIIYSTLDAAGNTATMEISEVSVYGLPRIDGVSDVLHTAGFGVDLLHNITASDSFGNPLTTYVSQGASSYNPDLPGKYTVAVSAEDFLGNLSTVQYEITVDAFRGAGTTADPFLIENLPQMKLVRLYQTSDFKLMTDIDLDGYQWTPVGNSTYPYTGTFDGNGKTIANLNKTVSGQYLAGLFGVMSGTVKNVRLTAFNITGLQVTTCGGIAANLTGGQIYGCSVEIAGLMSTNGAVRFGGIAGNITGQSSITNCNVSGQYYIHSYNSMESAYAGDVAGYSTGSLTLTNNYSSCASGGYRASSSFFYLGNIIGGFIAGTDTSFANNLFDTTVDQVFKEQNPSLFNSTNKYISDSWVSSSTSGAYFAVNCSGYSTSLMQSAATFDSFNPAFWSIEDGSYPLLKLINYEITFDGEGTAVNPYLIENIFQLDLVRYFPDRHFKLACDIDNPSFQFLSIPLFGGSFDGNGKTVLISIAGKNYSGIFADLRGDVYDLDLNIVSIQGQYAGTVAAELYGGSISGVTVTIQNMLGQYGGGIVARMYSGIIRDCEITFLNTSSTSSRGGVAAIVDGGLIEGCVVRGVTSSAYTYDTQYSGGITAQLRGGIIRNCLSELDIYCYTSTTGASRSFAGGIVAHMSGGTISACVSTGLVYVDFSTSFDYGYSYAGGIAGWVVGGTIEDCYTESELRSYEWSYYRLGGVVGFVNADNAVVIRNCYADNTITADTHTSYYKGGIVGYANGGIFVNCFYNIEKSNILSAVGKIGSPAPSTENINGVDAASMLLGETYSGFGEFVSLEDLSESPWNVWVFEADKKPSLYWEQQ